MEYIKKTDLLAKAVEVEYLNRPRLMVSVATIGNMPSIELKRGEWKINNNGWAYCSECERLGLEVYNFCPNCGADMRERSD